MAGRNAWLNEMARELAQDMEANPEEYRAIARDLAERDGKDPERVYQWFLTLFTNIAVE